jgi:hypothetical protein
MVVGIKVVLLVNSCKAKRKLTSHGEKYFEGSVAILAIIRLQKFLIFFFFFSRFVKPSLLLVSEFYVDIIVSFFVGKDLSDSSIGGA